LFPLDPPLPMRRNLPSHRSCANSTNWASGSKDPSRVSAQLRKKFLDDTLAVVVLRPRTSLKRIKANIPVCFLHPCFIHSALACRLMLSFSDIQ
jgi:hypothetical protein